jgi:tagatose-1,6-bisphosphate aldolase non-catalytic subunit AgaZ/GatZ
VQIVEELSTKCTLEEFEFFVVIVIRIWFHRNTLVHGGDFLNPNLFG